MEIHKINLQSLTEKNIKTQDKESIEDSFKKTLHQVLDKVNDAQYKADDAIKKFAAGEIEDVHQVMTAVEEAHLALKLTIQIKNKIVESYQEIMRMQV